jgi:hypothetical protein
MSINLNSGLPGRIDGAAIGAGFIGQVLTATSSTKTPNVQDAWHDFTGNSVDLTPGVWEISGAIAFDNTSGPDYYVCWGAWCTTAGNNTTTLPTFLVPTGGLNNIQVTSATAMSKHFITMPNVYVRTNTGSTVIYLNANSNQTNGAAARVTCYITAKRVG